MYERNYRVDFVGCHHVEEQKGLATYSDMDGTNSLLNEKLEVLGAKGYEIISIVPVVSGRGVSLSIAEEKDLSKGQMKITRLIHYLGTSRKERKKMKKSGDLPSFQEQRQVDMRHLEFGYSYTQGFNIFSRKVNHA